MNETHASPREGAAAPHALPAPVLVATAAALMALTVLTVVASRIDLGAFNVVLALAIAGLKASLVALFFMHLRYENRFSSVVFVTAVFFAVLLVGLVVFDTTQYQPDLRAAQQAAQRAGPR
ncbi:MAG TPA: cytochrome C oxidase subunit IV family protein [Anaeromyxobacteraceae bacterium]|nr:cytochrome C oxidase subunit IV family protein [Anaeromyxobacteraceae bacterium]